MNPGSLPSLARNPFWCLVLVALAGCAAGTTRASEGEDDNTGAIVGDFCWSKYPLLQAEKSCAPPEEAALAQEACTRVALDALTHSHAANRDWFGMCMARHGLSRLGQE